MHAHMPIIISIAPTWLNLSRDHGMLGHADLKGGHEVPGSHSSVGMGGEDFHEVFLYFSRSTMGVYSAYLLIENLTNPSDLKLVRVT